MLDRKIIEKLPEGVDAERITAHLALKTGLGRSWGETVLLLHDGAFLALTRGSVLEGFEVVALDARKAPRFEAGSWESKLIVTTDDGAEHGLTLSELDKERACDALAVMYEALEMPEAQAEILEFRLSMSDITSQQVALHTRLGALYTAPLDAPDKALDHNLAALRLDPTIDDALRAVEAVAETADDAQARALLAELVDVYRHREDWDEVAEALLDLADMDEVEGDTDLALKRWLEGMDVAELRLSNPALALEAGVRALQHTPDDEGLIRRIEQYAQQTAAWEALVKALELAVTEVLPPLSIELRARIAQLYSERLGDPEHAIESWRLILLEDPTDLRAMEALEELYVLLERWVELADVLEERAVIEAGHVEQIALLTKLAMIHEEMLEQLDHAVDAWRRVLDLDPLHEDALAHLERLFTVQERWHELTDILQVQVELAATVPEKVRAQVALARVQADQLDDAERAIMTLELALVEAPDDRKVQDLLIEQLRAREDWLRLEGVLELALTHTTLKTHRRALLEELAHVVEHKLHDPERAASVWERLLEEDRRHAGALRALCGWYRSAEQHAMLEDALGRLGALASLEADERWRCRRERALVLEEQLRDRARALVIWQNRLVSVSDDLEALEAVARLHRLDDNPEARVEALMRHADVLAETGEAEAASARWMEAVTVAEEELRKQDRAAEICREVLKHDPHHAAADAALERLLREQRDWQALIDLMLSRAKRDEDQPDLWAPYVVEAAQLADKRLKQPSRAMDLWWQLAPLRVEDESYRAELYRLAAASNRWMLVLERWTYRAKDSDPTQAAQGRAWMPEAVKLFERRAEAFKGADAWLDVAVLYEDTLDDHTHALKAAERALAIEPEHLGAQATVRELLRRSERWKDLARLLNQMVEQSRHDEGQQELLYEELLEIYTVHMPSPSEAEEVQTRLKSIQRSADWLWLVVLVIVAAISLVVILFVV